MAEGKLGARAAPDVNGVGAGWTEGLAERANQASTSG
jgi:hypothetical protein